MGCYTVPLVAALIHYGLRKQNSKRFDTQNSRVLNLLFAGGAIFGVVDHAVNGELLVFSVRDLLLGLVITASIVVVGAILALKNPNNHQVSA